MSKRGDVLWWALFQLVTIGWIGYGLTGAVWAADRMAAAVSVPVCDPLVLLGAMAVFAGSVVLALIGFTTAPLQWTERAMAE